MIEGKLNKQLSDVSLLKQPFVKDPSITIENYLSQADAEIESFVRLEVGEGIEVEKRILLKRSNLNWKPRKCQHLREFFSN